VNGVIGNAYPQRVALKDTQELKVRLQECLQLSGTNSQANRQKGQNPMFNGSQKPVCDVQSGYKKETGYKANGKQEQSSSVQAQRPNHMPAQRTDHPASKHTKDDDNKENEQAARKSTTAKYVNYSLTSTIEEESEFIVN